MPLTTALVTDLANNIYNSINIKCNCANIIAYYPISNHSHILIKYFQNDYRVKSRFLPKCPKCFLLAIDTKIKCTCATPALEKRILGPLDRKDLPPGYCMGPLYSGLGAI